MTVAFPPETWLAVIAIASITAYAILRMVITQFRNQSARHDLRVAVARLRADQAAALRAAREAADDARRRPAAESLVRSKAPGDGDEADANADVEVAEAVEVAAAVEMAAAA